MNVFNRDNTKELFEFLEACQGINQMECHHPEGDVFIHSLQTLWWAFRESHDVDLILAAMLHDIGKVHETKGHEQKASKMLYDYVSPKTLWLIEQHMRIWYYILGDMRQLSKCVYLGNHPWLPELVQLARWDKLARSPRKKIHYDKDAIVEKLNLAANKHFVKKEDSP